MRPKISGNTNVGVNIDSLQRIAAKVSSNNDNIVISTFVPSTLTFRWSGEALLQFTTLDYNV